MQVPLVDPRARESAPQYPGPSALDIVPRPHGGVRHEKNTYGYLDAALNSVFHPAQRFQINPQYPLCPAVTVGTSAHEQNVSIGSVGEIFGARGTGREEDMLYPDFLVTKAIPRGLKTPRINRPVVLIEVKTMVEAYTQIVRKNATAAEALLQLGKYCEPMSESAFAVKREQSYHPSSSSVAFTLNWRSPATALRVQSLQKHSLILHLGVVYDPVWNFTIMPSRATVRASGTLLGCGRMIVIQQESGVGVVVGVGGWNGSSYNRGWPYRDGLQTVTFQGQGVPGRTPGKGGTSESTEPPNCLGMSDSFAIKEKSFSSPSSSALAYWPI
ncbi:hypothetical protein B0H10DRAFT_2202715 [Mycena sp. CBHHK59/15]|nr:hypothetical protein B0H10DRAFT_2202715 [Mycena sp. CBHHK59/15]